ncbi:hypothetical protein RISK_004032 [Rhodopirellula islandica]|uniref:Uncharacterized protein n=1 Tax=Rhodopirellula islandica TaxID=595434 RepID=A0A0J1BA73_RHOIS|nr:hypothetical protein RISK_004032 [Rhodopirellula islandica]
MNAMTIASNVSDDLLSIKDNVGTALDVSHVNRITSRVTRYAR